MPLKTMLINGPSGGGKSTVARLIVRDVLRQPVHLVRLRAAHDGHTNSVERLAPAGEGSDWASRHRVTYTAERIFETLPDGLRAVRHIEPAGLAVVEADGDPAVRHAFPYDYRVFVMAAPVGVEDVFREARDAAVALQQVMLDTAAFASEIFGLFDADSLDDSRGVHHRAARIPSLQPEIPRHIECLDVAETQVQQFLDSPIGAEIAARIQLQPEYHALVEADVVLINTRPGDRSAALKECIRRIEKLLSRIRHDARRHSVLFWGDVNDDTNPLRATLICRLKNLIEG
ncbi:MAG TPA: hypothetical protein VLM89_03885 [Phycisphaerae bacterium]|nr:hypothetical protein [Phycisphaerae bacterium]